MAEQQDPEIPDVPEHDLSEEDMMFVFCCITTS